MPPLTLEEFMNHLFSRPIACLFSALLIIAVAGCGSTQQKKDKDFFTSGSPEADQRADQRMAQQQQLTGNSNNGGQKTTTNNANIATEKRSLYESLGGADGINAIVDDFVNRALADPRVNWDRIGIKRGGFSLHRDDSVTWDSNAGNVKIMKMHIAQFLALSTGGPTTYTGKDRHTR